LCSQRSIFDKGKPFNLQTDPNRDQIWQLARTASSLLFIDTPTVTADTAVYCKLFTFSSSSSVGPVANATDVLQPSRLIVLTLSPPACLDVPTFAARYPHVHNDARDTSSERWNCVGENKPVILHEIATSSIQGSFTCRKSATWDPRLYFPSGGRCAEDFFTLKNPDGFGQV